MSNISRNKGNQTVIFDKSIEDNVGNIFLQTMQKNEAGRLFPDVFWFFRRTLYEVDAIGQYLKVSIYFGST